MFYLIKSIWKTQKAIFKLLKNYVDKINDLEKKIKNLNNEQLRQQTSYFKLRYFNGETLENILPEAFAVVREASLRTIGLRHFDVQLMGGISLHLGNIAEMKTGEGKTLAATLPSYLNAITGKSVHIITVNEYLASYQSNLMNNIFNFLNIKVGCLKSNQTIQARKNEYKSDIVYGTNNEFGFDYLKDNMRFINDQIMQRDHNFAILDEVDSILIDEARTPLIISGPISINIHTLCIKFAYIVSILKIDVDYKVDNKKRSVGILESGIKKVESSLKITNLYKVKYVTLIGFLNNALKAKELFKKDRDYIILKNKIVIVDEHTGRILPGRRYSDGLHQSIEAKEKVKIKDENQTLATITLQNYFRLYKKISGMTGTAQAEASEFMNTYKLGVIRIPTNKPMIRIDHPDKIYKNEKVKFKAIVKDIKSHHKLGQPILVGTTSVEKSEYLSLLLKKEHIIHNVLNAKNHAKEANIISQAGKKGAVTVATNMAGRGTDIMLGGNFIQDSSQLQLNNNNKCKICNNANYCKKCKFQINILKNRNEVIKLGGLYVLGTERHESRRIDNQLRGRSGRQGDPGETRFYLSLQDSLMKIFNTKISENLLKRFVLSDDIPIDYKIVSKAIASAQTQIESRNAEQRKDLLKYDDVMNRQREVIYNNRRSILRKNDLSYYYHLFIKDIIRKYLSQEINSKLDLRNVESKIKKNIPISLKEFFFNKNFKNIRYKDKNNILFRKIFKQALFLYKKREIELGSDNMRSLEKEALLLSIANNWKLHLYEMEYLKEGIGLRSIAHRDPLIEYQKEGFALFEIMKLNIKENSVQLVFDFKTHKI